MHAKCIYEPWKAPVQEQRKAEVVIKVDGSTHEKGMHLKLIFDFSVGSYVMEVYVVCLYWGNHGSG
jgi:hypothetical protein